MSDVKVGQTVELSDGRSAIVRFVGQPHFAAGDWIGVELEDASGKNDGSVQGERYFDCEMGRGMFLRPTAVRVVEQPVPKPVAARKVSRPSSVVGPGAAGRRPSSVQDAAAARRQSINAPSPSPATRGSRPSSMLRVGVLKLDSSVHISLTNLSSPQPNHPRNNCPLQHLQPRRQEPAPPQILALQSQPRRKHGPALAVLELLWVHLLSQHHAHQDSLSLVARVLQIGYLSLRAERRPVELPSHPSLNFVRELNELGQLEVT